MHELSKSILTVDNNIKYKNTMDLTVNPYNIINVLVFRVPQGVLFLYTTAIHVKWNSF